MNEHDTRTTHTSRQRQGKQWYTLKAPEQFDRAELG